MGSGGMLRISVPLLKKHMEEEGKALTMGEAAEILGMSHSGAIAVLDSMEAIGIVQRVRTRKNLYFLKDTYDEERIKTMLQEADERTQSGTVIYGVASHRSKYDPIIDRFLEIEDELVSLDVEGKKPYYLVAMLNRRIKARELDDRIKASAVNKCVYLEKI